jgi:hypothetical protein
MKMNNEISSNKNNDGNKHVDRNYHMLKSKDGSNRDSSERFSVWPLATSPTTVSKIPKASDYRPATARDDDDDCDRPACDGMNSMMQQMKKLSTTTTTTAAASTSSSSSDTNPMVSKEECPPTSATLGKGSWTLLHSMVRVGKLVEDEIRE